jgi:hypothetical protein
VVSDKYTGYDEQSPVMSYTHYALISLKGKVVMGMFPDLMSAGLKAFRQPEQMKSDLEHLERCFPPGPERLWVAANDGGGLAAMKGGELTEVLGYLSLLGEDIYLSCNEKLPQLHKYEPFMATISPYQRSPYEDWQGVTKKYLKKMQVSESEELTRAGRAEAEAEAPKMTVVMAQPTGYFRLDLPYVPAIPAKRQKIA